MNNTVPDAQGNPIGAGDRVVRISLTPKFLKIEQFSAYTVMGIMTRAQASSDSIQIYESAGLYDADKFIKVPTE
jgi:hypothetical protein